MAEPGLGGRASGLRSRGRFLGEAFVRGSRPAYAVVGLLSLIFGVAGVYVLNLGFSWALVAVLALTLVALMEGAYQVNKTAADEIARLQKPHRELPTLNPSGEMSPDHSKPIATKEELERSNVKHRSVFVADIPLEGERVRNKVFEDCDLYGPAVLHGRNVEYEYTVIGTDLDNPEAVIWEIQPGRTFIGGLPLEGCRLVRCRTFGIGFAGPPEAMNQLRQIQPLPNP